MNEGLRFWPAQASTVAGSVDTLMAFIFLIAVAIAALVALLILYFIVRYHHSRPADRSNPTTFHLPLELAWTGIPLVLALVMFLWGAKVYIGMRQPPANAMEIYVIGKQWMWKIQHLEGRQEINELHIPVGRPIKLIMTSEDVIHDFFVPAFRVKQDVLPGRYTSEWFQATQAGTWRFFCAQYCGTSHSQMIGYVTAMPPAEFERWLAGPAAPTGPETPSASAPAVSAAPAPGAAPAPLDPGMVKAGEKLFVEFQCAGCHKADGSGRGPSLNGVAGKPVPLEGSQAVTADENYIRESILQPKAKMVKGYKAIMPTYEGQLEDAELMQLIAYVKSLASQPPVVNHPSKDGAP